jgi:hypothetical protein
MDVRRLDALRALAAIAEGATVRRPVCGLASIRVPPADCVAVVLGDALRRLSVLGGREDLPRSLGSVLGRATWSAACTASVALPATSSRRHRFVGQAFAVSRYRATVSRCLR